MNIEKIIITALGPDGSPVVHIEEEIPFIMSKLDYHMNLMQPDILAGRVCHVLIERQPAKIDKSINPGTAKEQWWHEKYGNVD
jgi:hypothetical protein